MPKLTRSRMSQIEEALDLSLFTSAAFEVSSTDDPNLVVSITYRDEPSYHAQLYYAERAPRSIADFGNMLSRERILYSEFCPGSFIQVERESDQNFDKFLEGLKDWTRRLRSEVILVNAFEKQFKEFQEDLNKKLEEHFSDAKAHFTAQEKDEALSRLREFQQKIEELEKANQATQSQVNELKKVITDLTQAASTMPKKAWYRTACSKLFNIGAKIASSQAGQKAIEVTIDRLLTGPKTN